MYIYKYRYNKIIYLNVILRTNDLFDFQKRIFLRVIFAKGFNIYLFYEFFFGLLY